MEELQIDWKQDPPNKLQLKEMWARLEITPIEKWENGTKVLKQKVSETHINGGIQLHKFQLKEDKALKWFATRNRLDEIGFVITFLKRPELQQYRNAIKINDIIPKVNIIKWWTDIYDLPGNLSRILGQGGAYKKLNSQEAWQIATKFVEEEFQNRFNEFIQYELEIENADWFYDIAWDYSVLLFDKRNYQIIIIDITDTD
jgi:hypothetical protein